jgi:peptidoglycan/xylan/chitin deacetylase (PgdA/CDA1 family)
MKTIAQQLNVTDFPFVIKDKNNNEIYYESSKGYWVKREYNKNNNEIYWEDDDGDWEKREFDGNNNKIYYEDSYGTIIDNRPKSIPEFTMEELIAKVGFDFKIKK